MRIALDFSPALRNRFSGFWTYGVGLLGGLVAAEDVTRIILLCSGRELPSARLVPFWDHPKNQAMPTTIRLRRWERWWRFFPRPRLQRLSGPFDVYHCLHHLMPPTGGCPRVLTVYDLRRYRLPELYRRSKLGLFEQAVAKADRILAVSQSTRSDLIEFLGVAPDRVDVVHLGTPEGFAPIGPDRRRAVLDRLSQRFGRRVGGFAATIGSRDRRKNVGGVVRGFSRAVTRLRDDFRLLVIGNVAEDPQLRAALSEVEVADSVMFSECLSQEELRSILPGARMLLFLSLYEGFGLPLLEAMASGVPIIASDRSSVPEIVAEAGILVDPEDPDAAARQIVALAGDDDLYDKLVRAGLARCKDFTWQRTAEQTLACYRGAIAGGP